MRLNVLPTAVETGPSSMSTCVDLSFFLWVLISMMVMCNDIAYIEHDEIIPGLPNAQVVIEHDNNRTKI